MSIKVLSNVIVAKYQKFYTVSKWSALTLFLAAFIFAQISEVDAKGKDAKGKEAKEKEPYLSEVYVDTMVTNAYYNFLSAEEASQITGSEFRQSQAINHGKMVAAKLKKLAKGDPNRGYIYWRVGELENQIFLEEEELRLKKEYELQKAINILVEKFNAEIGKWRPDFLNLTALHSAMYKIKPAKADELSWLIEDRKENISREVAFLLEKALVAEDWEKAKEEFEYIRKNRKYLFISYSKYESFENRIRIKQEADDMIANIDKYVTEIHTIINENNIAYARRHVESLENRVNEVRALVPTKNYNQFKNEIKQLSKILCHKEDSLVNENMALIKAKRIDAAVDYLENVVQKQGVSNKKIVMLNNAIMEIPGQKRVESFVDDSVDQELIAFANTQTEGNEFSLDDIQAKARQKADSAKAYEEEQAFMEQNRYGKKHKRDVKKAKRNILKIYKLLEKNEVEKAYEEFQNKRRSLETYSSKEEFSNLQKAINRAKNPVDQKLVKNREKARIYTDRIYSLLRNNEVEKAHKKFNELLYPLKKYSSKESFTNLQQAVTEAYQPFLEEKKIRENQQMQTEAELASTEPADSVNINDSSVVTTSEQESAIPDIANKNLIAINTLLEQNKIKTAYEQFIRNRTSLNNDLPEEVFIKLESKVIQAYQSLNKTEE